ncbi:hypothetical protein, partial [Acidianus sp. RZ1]|uniref:hypothetical protein n=1 Tax=Acidianus sp. RZ1 TaxID=1540082 RepID=UPI001827CF34
MATYEGIKTIAYIAFFVNGNVPIFTSSIIYFYSDLYNMNDVPVFNAEKISPASALLPSYESSVYITSSNNVTAEVSETPPGPPGPPPGPPHGPPGAPTPNLFEVEDASTGTEVFYFVPLIIKYTNNVNTYCITFSPAPPPKPPAGPSSIPVIVNGKPITKICHFAINGYYDIGFLFQYNNPPPNSNSAFACVYSMIIISPASGVYYFYF